VTLASMTGYARADGQSDAFTWTWELKSVNGRALDIRCRLPNGMDALEGGVRATLAERFARGNITAALQLTRAAEAGGVQVNRALLDQLLALAREFDGAAGVAPPRLDALLTTRGVIEIGDPEEDDDVRSEREAAMLTSLDEAVAGLAAARAQEGQHLANALASQLADIDRLTDAALKHAATQPDAIKARLDQQLSALLGETPPLPEERLAQEVAVLVVKADVREELDRLAAHIVQARELLAAEGAVGRRLDFLAQEFNREANTLCSKSADVTLIRIGLDLKVVIDQFREQSQNIE
jgi:uncharacterized protein (TIGR00255 family)